MRDPTNPAASALSVAYHGAGHAVAAIHSGFRVFSASIEPYRTGRRTMNGQVLFTHPVASRAVRGFTEDRKGIVFFLSGVAAELLLAGAEVAGAAELTYADGELQLVMPSALLARYPIHGAASTRRRPGGSPRGTRPRTPRWSSRGWSSIGEKPAPAWWRIGVRWRPSPRHWASGARSVGTWWRTSTGKPGE
jgi:hypothetical protein